MRFKPPGSRFMETTEKDLERAEAAMNQARHSGVAVAARYDRRVGRIVVTLDSGLELAFPPRLAEGLKGAGVEALSRIEISPSGLGLHWPALDAVLFVPGLIEGTFGSKAWMAREMGAKGGRTRSSAKAEAARQNGKRGGRPRKTANG
jgi:hypothetical protein